MVFIAPIKTIFSGDKIASQRYIKFAHNQLAILERQMTFQNLNEGHRVISPFDWLIINCVISFGRKEVTIYVTPKKYMEDKVKDVDLLLEQKQFVEKILPLSYLYACGAPVADAYHQKIQIAQIPPKDNPLNEWQDNLIDYGDPLEVSPIMDLQPTQFIQLKYKSDIITLDDLSEVKTITSISFSGIPGFFKIRVTTAIGGTGNASVDDFDALKDIILPSPGASKNTTIVVPSGASVSVFDYLSYSNTLEIAELAANFNDDKSKLYIFHATLGMVYERQISGGVVEYILLNSFTINPPATISNYGKYVDTNGIAYLGYSSALGDNPDYDPSLVTGANPIDNPYYLINTRQTVTIYTYWELDLNTEVYSESSLKTNGTTIIDGELAPITWEVKNSLEESYLGGVIYYDFGDPEDSVYYNVDSYPCEEQYISNLLVETHSNGDYYGEIERNCSLSISQVVMGIHYPSGSLYEKQIIESFYGAWTGVSVEYSNGGPLITGASLSATAGSITSYTYISFTRSDPVYSFELPMVILPISIANALGINGFLLVDNNTSDEFPYGITIGGSYYTPYLVDSFGEPILNESGSPTTDTPRWQIEFNGKQIQDNVFYDEIIDSVRIQNCLFTEAEFKHLGFLF